MVLKDVVKVFPVSSSSFARKATGGGGGEEHEVTRGMTRPEDEMGSQIVFPEFDIFHPILVGTTTTKLKLDAFQL